MLWQIPTMAAQILLFLAILEIELDLEAICINSGLLRYNWIFLCCRLVENFIGVLRPLQDVLKTWVFFGKLFKNLPYLHCSRLAYSILVIRDWSANPVKHVVVSNMECVFLNNNQYVNFQFLNILLVWFSLIYIWQNNAPESGDILMFKAY